jgi:hypothetical protein
VARVVVVSITGKRQAIADALSTVDGVSGFLYRPTTPKPGDAWPLLGSAERAAGLAFLVTWRVHVLLPQDEVQASVWLDQHVGDLVDALNPVGYVAGFQPITLPASGSDRFGFEFSLRSE